MFDLPRVERNLALLESLFFGHRVSAENLRSCDFMPDYDLPLDHPPALDEAQFRPFAPNEVWGGRYGSKVFRCEIVLAPDMVGKPISLIASTNLDARGGAWAGCNPQCLVWVDGALLAAMDANHMTLAVDACGKTTLDVTVWAVTGHPMAGHTGNATFALAAGARNESVVSLYYDIGVPAMVAKQLPANDTRRECILRLLCDALNLLDFRVPGDESFFASVETARAFMRDKFYGEFCGETLIAQNPTVHAVGHTHIDVAYRWTLDDARDKTLRSFTTQLRLMEQYPEFVFMSSQPKLYDWYRERAPENHKKIAQRVKQGRWEPEGAMWLEADCNVTSGESLVRQVLRGTRYFKDEFGVDCRVLWLPDVFGYNAALPGILAGFGIPYFMTTKISWNETNCMPHDTFMWRGVDGSEVLTHFITTQDHESGPRLNPHNTTYNGILVPGQVMTTWDRYQQKTLSSDVLMAFGHGDGGGGVMPEMLEVARRLEKGIPGCPKVKMTTSAAFFDKLAENAKGKNLPKWVGEMYLEFHRGTYTTNGYVKRMNRLCENHLFALEQLLALRMTMGAQYAYDQLDALWEKVLTRQFHDILPGSSVKEVYEECKRVYPEVLAEVDAMTTAALSSLAGRGDRLLIYNPAPFDRIAEASVPTASLAGCAWPFTAQADARADGHTLFGGIEMRAGEIKSFAPIKAVMPAHSKIRASLSKMENDFGVLTFGENMSIRYLDKATGRSVCGVNALKVFEDLPYRYDAWDINEFYTEKSWDVGDVISAEVVEDGPVRASVRVVRRFLSSTIAQDISLYADRPGVEFFTRVDWRETHLLLKAEFPVDVHHEKASYEIQFGVIERPTHRNTSWDAARFEVCAQRFMDVSEDGYGVALLNDSKYGHDALDGNMRITLIKSPNSPNIDSDREAHEFTYVLYPHVGSWREGGVAHAARALNMPVIALPGMGEITRHFVRVDGAESVFIEAVKAAEDRSGDVIVRLNEGFGRRAKARLSFDARFAHAELCDLGENPKSDLALSACAVEVEMKPFTIATVRLCVR